MAKGYRSYDERHAIIRSMIAETNPVAVEDHELTDSEEVYFRARALRAIDKATRDTSKFKSYYALPRARPFMRVVVLSAFIAIIAILVAMYVRLRAQTPSQEYPIIVACISAVLIAVGWAVAGWTTHRNTIRQNTNSIIFTRFSQSPFVDAVHRFNLHFGVEIHPLITPEIIARLRASSDDEDRKSAQAVIYMLNYYEFIASGVLRGDMDYEIVTANLRGLFIFYHDKCLPYIRARNKVNPRLYENLIKIRTHYRNI